MSLAEVAAATGGRVEGDPSHVVRAVATDSRPQTSDALFVALRGESADGHRYVTAARATGSTAALVERPDALAGMPGVVVADAWRAIGELAASVRTRVDPDVVAITGSVGKTSTKDLVRAAVAADRPTVAAEGSFNNELGVPLTLLATEHDTRALVVEIGARGVGHIASLTPWVRPDVAIVTAVAGAHLEMFGDLDGVALAKGELVEALPASGTAVLNAEYERVLAMAERTEARVLRYGSGAARGDVRAEQLSVDDRGRWSATVVTPWGSGALRMPVPGGHNLDNALAAVTAACALGVELEVALGGLAEASLSAHRAALTDRADGLLVVNDAYNANAASTMAALEMLGDLRRDGGRLVAVLGYMAELGPGASHEHDDVGARAGATADLVVVVRRPDRAPLESEEACALRLAALDSLRAGAAATGTEVVVVDDARAAVEALAGRVGDRDVVLCKASRSIGLEVVAQGLLDDDTPRDDARRPAPRSPGEPLEAHT